MYILLCKDLGQSVQIFEALLFTRNRETFSHEKAFYVPHELFCFSLKKKKYC